MSATMSTWWLWIGEDELRIELRQLEDEGRDVSRLRRRFESLLALKNPELAKSSNQDKARELFDAAQRLPQRKNYEFEEPSDLDGIRRLRPRASRRPPPSLSPKQRRDRIHAAWVGRCAGCLLGKPLEGTRSWAIREFVESSGQWPLAGYLRYGGRGKIAAAYRKLYERAPCRHLMKDYHKLDHMPVDDDTNYTVAGLAIVKRHGVDFTPRDVALFWMRHFTIDSVCTAERVAYRNFCMDIAPPDSASFRNPFREWIGAQIRADAFGYLNVGNPERAADFAWRDASISHIKNGIYGEMFVAAALAAAPCCESIEAMLRAGLAEIPASSRLRAAIDEVFAWKASGWTYEQAVAKIHETWDENFGHNWCHTITNAVICAVALLWSEDDFATAIGRAIYPGYDTDCNGATVGSLFGMLRGPDAIGEEWRGKLNNTLKTGLPGYETVAIDRIARETADLAKSLS